MLRRPNLVVHAEVLERQACPFANARQEHPDRNRTERVGLHFDPLVVLPVDPDRSFDIAQQEGVWSSVIVAWRSADLPGIAPPGITSVRRGLAHEGEIEGVRNILEPFTLLRAPALLFVLAFAAFGIGEMRGFRGGAVELRLLFLRLAGRQ